ncbi:MAG: phosphoenolpyruvate-utilizing N-terminal domain-containing protein, partial [Acidobacteriota bacterium]
MRIRLDGIGASPGIVVAPARVLQAREVRVIERQIEPDEREAEVERLACAVEGAREELHRLRDEVGEKLGEKFSHLFDAHVLILDDRAFTAETAQRIREQGENAEWALKTVVRRLLDVFASIEDAHLSERGGDVEDVYQRLLNHLAGSCQPRDMPSMDRESIVVARGLSPSDTALLNRDKVVGFVTEMGGRTSHTAIIANALEIPAVVGVPDVMHHVKTGDLLIVDGSAGTILIDPSRGEQDQAAETRNDYAEQEASFSKDRDVPAVTTDGVPIVIRANIE